MKNKLKTPEPVDYQIPLSQPYTCPVCGGNGLVKNDFYGCDYIGYTISTTSITCRSCNGTGIVWKTLTRESFKI